MLSPTRTVSALPSRRFMHRSATRSVRRARATSRPPSATTATVPSTGSAGGRRRRRSARAAGRSRRPAVPGSGRGSCARTSAGTCATAGWRAASASATSAEVYARGGVGAGQPFQIQTPDGQVAPPPPPTAKIQTASMRLVTFSSTARIDFILKNWQCGNWASPPERVGTRDSYKKLGFNQGTRTVNAFTFL